MTPRLSVVMPTHNHSAILRRTLEALAAQTAAADAFEVVVVADGCVDDTGAMVRSLAMPYALTLIEQPGSGAATARNRGTAQARAPIVLFLDDDMEALPELVAAHLRAHERRPGGVVLGHFPLAATGRDDPLEAALRGWWERGFGMRNEPYHRFTFLDFCTGNVSLPRELFERMGGFDTRFPGASTEDYELGVRLLAAGVRFQYAGDAASLHRDPPSFERQMRRAAADGRGHVTLTSRHPSVLAHLKLATVPRGAVGVRLWRWTWERPALAQFVASLCRAGFRATYALGLEGLMWRFYGCLDQHAYWSSVRRELGSLAAWRRRVSEGEAAAPRDEIDIDVRSDLPELETLLEERRPSGARLRYGDVPLGRIAPVAGAEPLRPIHIRHLLVEQLGHALMAARTLDELATAHAPTAADPLPSRPRPLAR